MKLGNTDRCGIAKILDIFLDRYLLPCLASRTIRERPQHKKAHRCGIIKTPGFWGTSLNYGVGFQWFPIKENGYWDCSATSSNAFSLIIRLTLNPPAQSFSVTLKQKAPTDDMIWIKKTLGLILVVELLGNENFGAPKDLDIFLHVHSVGVFIEGKRVISVWGGCHKAMEFGREKLGLIFVDQILETLVAF